MAFQMILFAIAGVVFFFVLVCYIFRAFVQKRVDEILRKFQGRNILLIAKNTNFFGQESLGMMQVRGNGVLILEKDQLFFEMWAPQREYVIPISDIYKVSIVKSHLSKTKGLPLLKVHFTNEKTEEDSGAWLVKDLEQWREKLDSMIVKPF